MSASNAEQKSVEKSLQKENKGLRTEIKQLEIKVKTMQGDLNKSTALKDRLEGLCRELQKQNRFIKAESSAKIAEANAKGKELAQEVQNNMGFMKNINQNLASITSESLEVKRENEDLAKKIATLKDHYEEREKILQTALSETNALLLIAKQELGEFKLKNAEEKEKLYGEMQQLANALVQSREQMKEAKETEITLRNLIQNYDDKFNGLQKALNDTNGAYDEFKNEMSKVTGRTKELEKETSKWQSRWEESHTALGLMDKNHQRLQGELVKAQESLAKMTNLCRALQVERKDLLGKLKDEDAKRGIVNAKPDEAELQLTERAKLVDEMDVDPQPIVPDKIQLIDVVEEVSKLLDSSELKNSGIVSAALKENVVASDPKAVDSSSSEVKVSLDEAPAAPAANIKDTLEDKAKEVSQGGNNNTASKQNQKGKKGPTPSTPTKNKNKKSQNKNQPQPCSPSEQDIPQESEIEITASDKATEELPEKSPPSNIVPLESGPNITPEDNAVKVVGAIEETEIQTENVSEPNVETPKVVDLEKRDMESSIAQKREPEKDNPVIAAIPTSNSPPSPKPPAKETPKSNKKGQGTPKANSGEETLPKPNKKSKKHK